MLAHRRQRQEGTLGQTRLPRKTLFGGMDHCGIDNYNSKMPQNSSWSGQLWNTDTRRKAGQATTELSFLTGPTKKIVSSLWRIVDSSIKTKHALTIQWPQIPGYIYLNDANTYPHMWLLTVVLFTSNSQAVLNMDATSISSCRWTDKAPLTAVKYCSRLEGN